ncbi:hypothetical protein VHEMI01129 [[Torrubiella] hemipterigena]|uniref:Uncharacterized protein n=1 Tax=[Torrubiella] hemipterigena TaxID=1531966 RepID=A0A0A1T6I5_9HYPO|nr:hypothetical protein VHEMI01129 [[Torrubiella] hemipterigena]
MSRVVLSPNAFRDIDTEGEERFIATLCAAVNGIVEPAVGASAIDILVREQSLEAYTKYKESEERDDGVRDVTNWQRYLWRLLAEAAMALTPGYLGQDVLIHLVQELMLLPKHSLLWINYYGEEHQLELWTVNYENCFGDLPSLMFSLTNSDDSLATRYVRFSSVHARLVGACIANVLDLCPFGSFGYAITRDKAGPGDDDRVLAASQWTFNAGMVLWEICEKRVWNYYSYGPHIWKSWAAVFTRAAAADNRYGNEAREAARQALHHMKDVEKQGIISNVSIVDVFGMRVIADSDEEVDEEEENKE